MTEGSSQRSLDVVGADVGSSVRERRQAVFGPGEALRREKGRHIDSTLGLTIAAAAKTAVFIIVTARGSHRGQELSSAMSPLARA